MTGGRRYEPLEEEHERAGKAREEPAPASPEPLPPLSQDFKTDLDAALDRDIGRVHERAAELKTIGVASVSYELASEDTAARLAFEKREADRAKSPVADDANAPLEEDHVDRAITPPRQQFDDEREAQPLGKYDSLRDHAASLGDVELTEAQQERLDRLLGSDSGMARESDRANSSPGQGRLNGGGRERSR